MINRALITEEFHPLLAEGLEKIGYEVIQQWDINADGVKAIIKDFQLIVVNSKIKIDGIFLENASQLKTIIRIGSGLEIVDIDACHRRGIQLISTPEGNANAVAEHVLGFLLSSFNHLHRAQLEMIRGIWSRESNRGQELCGKTIGIIGCGYNGSRLVKLLSGFDVEVLVYDVQSVHQKLYSNSRQVNSFDEIFELADIISLHLPLDSQTHHLVNDHFIRNFVNPIHLVNASRGGICDMEAIQNGLKTGKILSAMLDVFENEPFHLDNNLMKWVEDGRLFISPHIAGWTYESKKRMAEIALEKLKAATFT